MNEFDRRHQDSRLIVSLFLLLVIINQCKSLIAIWLGLCLVGYGG